MKIFKLINLNFTRFIRNKKNFALMMLLPIVFIIIVFIGLNYYNRGNFKKLEVGIVNLDSHRDTALILSIIKETPSVKEIINFNELHDIKDVTEQINEKDIDCGIVIPQEFISGIYHNNKGEISLYSHSNSNLQTIIFKNLVYEVVDLSDYMRNSLNVLWESMKTANIPNETRIQIYEKEAKILIMNIVARDSMFIYENGRTIYVYYFVYIILVFMYINLIIMYRNMSSTGEEDISKRMKLMNYSNSELLISKGILSVLMQSIVNLFLIGLALLYLKVDIITILINILIITLYNGIVVITILNLLPKRSASFIGLISMLVFMIINGSSRFYNPLNKSINIIFDTLYNRRFIYYRSILLSVAAMVLMNILIVRIKKNFIVRKEGVYNENMSKLWY